MAERIVPWFRFGVFNPKHFIVSVIRDGARAEQAVAALRDAGFTPDDVKLVTGQQVLDNERVHAESKGRWERLAALFPAEEQAAVDGYVKEAERGAHFVAVKAQELEQRTVAKSILVSHGAHAIRYYGENTITDL